MMRNPAGRQGFFFEEGEEVMSSGIAYGPCVLMVSDGSGKKGPTGMYRQDTGDPTGFLTAVL
jgi:hypothetical protein